MATQEQKGMKAGPRMSGGAMQERPPRREPEQRLGRRDDLRETPWNDPFRAVIRRFFDPADRWPFGSPWGPSGAFQGTGSGLANFWTPQIETFQRGDEFVVRADLPGLEKQDVSVEVQDNALVIQGERSNEHEEEDEGYFTSERSYGRFCRVVPLPDGAAADSVKASFRNGVLEVVTQAPVRETSRGRKIEIAEDPSR